MKLGVCPKCEVPLPFGYIRCPRCDVEIDSAQSVPEVHAGPKPVVPTTRRVSDTQRFRATQRFATGRVQKKSAPPAVWVAAALALGLGIGFIAALSGSTRPAPVARPPKLAEPKPDPAAPPARPWVTASERLRQAKAMLNENRIDEALHAAEESRALFKELSAQIPAREIEDEMKQVEELIALCGKLQRPESIVPAPDVKIAPPAPKGPPKPPPSKP